MIEAYPIEISNKENALKIFSQQYKDSRDCIRELISNSIDERATFIRIRYIKNNIEITDNGYGLNQDDFQRVMTHVADSIKKVQIDMIGTKGIGIFGTLTLGSHITWESHKKGYDPLGIRISGDKIDQYEIIPSTLSEGITKYTIYNLTTSIKGIKPNQLCNYLSKKFGGLLQERGIVIHVEDKKGGVYPVKPEIYKGEKWKIGLVTVPAVIAGFISFDIYLLPFPDKEKKISIRCKGVEVISDVTEIKGLDHEPWSSDIVYGEIRADFLNTTSSRDGFIEDTNLDIFISMLQSYESDLQRLVNRKKDLIKRKRDKNLIKAVDELLKKAIEKMNPLLYPEKSIPREKREEYCKREIPPVPEITKFGKIKTQVKTDKEKSKNLKRGYPPWIFTRFPLEEINSRTKIIVENGKKTIFVNNSHEDYLRSIDRRTDITYIADMVMHEIILDSYKDKEHREYMEAMQMWAITKVESWS